MSNCGLKASRWRKCSPADARPFPPPAAAYLRTNFQSRAGKLYLTARSGNETYQTSIPFDASKRLFIPDYYSLGAAAAEEMMDQWRHSDENGQKKFATA